MDEIKNLKHEIDQLRMEIYTRSFPTQASASAQVSTTLLPNTLLFFKSDICSSSSPSSSSPTHVNPT